MDWTRSHVKWRLEKRRRGFRNESIFTVDSQAGNYNVTRILMERILIILHFTNYQASRSIMMWDCMAASSIV